MKSRTEQLHTIERENDILRATLARYASRDCDWSSEDEATCECIACTATRTLKSLDDWRFQASFPERLVNGLHPREAAHVAAFRKYMTGGDADERLAGILGWTEGSGFMKQIHDWPSARDWYVAVAVVQWLATNVGMGVLEAAGWKYTRFDEDRRQVDAILPQELP